MNEKQRTALTKLCERYDDVTFNPDDFRPVFDLPKGWVAGWVTDSHGVGCTSGVIPRDGSAHESAKHRRPAPLRTVR